MRSSNEIFADLAVAADECDVVRSQQRSLEEREGKLEEQRCKLRSEMHQWEEEQINARREQTYCAQGHIIEPGTWRLDGPLRDCGCPVLPAETP